MELVEEEAQVCRLCGNSESIYIDVFGEEGTKRFLDFKIRSKINILIEPNDGLPQIICLKCLGTIEFLCDFHNMCHNTQKNLGSSVEGASNNEKSQDNLESDGESNKENVLPISNEKPKAKSLQSDQTKVSSNTAEDEKNMAPQEKEVGNDKIANIPNEIQDLDANNYKKSSNQISKKEKASDKPVPNDENSQTDKTSTSDSVKDPVLKNQVQRSRSTRSEKNDKKINRRSKASSSVVNIVKKNDSKQSKKTIDKYFETPAQCQNKSTNVENVNPNQTQVVTTKNSDEDAEQNNVIFEGTIINSPGDTSIIMPLKTGSFNNQLRLEDVEMADGSEIVQAQEIVWISSNSQQLPEPEKPKTMNTNQSKTTSPAPGDEAEIMKMDGTLIVQTSGQDMNLTTSTEKVIVLEVQLPAKENSVALPKSTEVLKRNRSISNVSSRLSSGGKSAKISELMTDQQKKDIETLYSIDMTRVDEAKVNENVNTLDKCKFECKLCDTVYPRLDKCQVHIWRHLDMKPYLCKACEFSTLTVSNIRCHIRKSHLKIKPFQCHICNKCYNSTTLLEEHLNTHTGARPYQCDFCEFASSSKQVLAHHILIHKKEKDIKCDICGKGFYSKGRMKAHRITHNKEQAFKCKLCSTYVLHEDALERHYANVHTKDYVCKICNKVYKSKKALHNHESVHSEAKFVCPICPNVYKSTHILKEHILKHQGIRQYKCNSCSKSFAQQSHLAAHMAVHSNITYNCPGCQKGFNRHDNMKVHAKRCEKFLANPALQSLLTKRKISFSKNNTAKVSIQNENHNNSAPKQNRQTSNNDSAKAVPQEPAKDLQSKDNSTTAVENILSSKEF
ncbi:zinc finger protein 510 isoform X1 [Nasonia vitripennis]|uniref:Uncharacterized protein n=1 Tax=Nasonia vitripennis TaxID=7425 RepID=A0A7M7H351_NASVI|nr:zinc finger protein 510 isoform X1 [Nasonia vitripennis]